MLKQNLGRQFFIYAPIALSLGILAVLVYPNLEALQAAVKTARPFYLSCSLLFPLASRGAL